MLTAGLILAIIFIVGFVILGGYYYMWYVLNVKPFQSHRNRAYDLEAMGVSDVRPTAVVKVPIDVPDGKKVTAADSDGEKENDPLIAKSEEPEEVKEAELKTNEDFEVKDDNNEQDDGGNDNQPDFSDNDDEDERKAKNKDIGGKSSKGKGDDDSGSHDGTMAALVTVHAVGAGDSENSDSGIKSEDGKRKKRKKRDAGEEGSDISDDSDFDIEDDDDNDNEDEVKMRKQQRKKNRINRRRRDSNELNDNNDDDNDFNDDDDNDEEDLHDKMKETAEGVTAAGIVSDRKKKKKMPGRKESGVSLGTDYSEKSNDFKESDSNNSIPSSDDSTYNENNKTNTLKVSEQKKKERRYDARGNRIGRKSSNKSCSGYGKSSSGSVRSGSRRMSSGKGGFIGGLF